MMLRWYYYGFAAASDTGSNGRVVTANDGYNVHSALGVLTNIHKHIRRDKADHLAITIGTRTYTAVTNSCTCFKQNTRSGTIQAEVTSIKFNK